MARKKIAANVVGRGSHNELGTSFKIDINTQQWAGLTVNEKIERMRQQYSEIQSAILRLIDSDSSSIKNMGEVADLYSAQTELEREIDFLQGSAAAKFEKYYENEG